MRRLATATLLLFLSACDSGPASSGAAAALAEEQLAHHVGVIAYLYGYPMVDMYRRMHNETHRVDPEQDFYSPINTLSQLGDSAWAGWLDLRRGPLTLLLTSETRAAASIRVVDFHGNTHSARLETNDSGDAELLLFSAGGAASARTVLETGPGLAYLVVETSHALPAEAVRLQAPVEPAPRSEVRIVPLDPMRSLGYFELFNTLLRELPAEQADVTLLRQFDSIGMGPSKTFSQAGLSPARKRGLERAIRDARTLLQAIDLEYQGPGVLGRAAAYRRSLAALKPTRESLPAVGSQ